MCVCVCCGLLLLLYGGGGEERVGVAGFHPVLFFLQYHSRVRTKMSGGMEQGVEVFFSGKARFHNPRHTLQILTHSSSNRAAQQNIRGRIDGCVVYHL